MFAIFVESFGLAFLYEHDFFSGVSTPAFLKMVCGHEFLSCIRGLKCKMQNANCNHQASGDLERTSQLESESESFCRPKNPGSLSIKRLSHSWHSL